MVDPGTHNKKEKTERPKKTLPENTHHGTKRDLQKGIPRGKNKVPGSNKKGKNKFMEGIL
jgi:hypothetical protein